MRSAAFTIWNAAGSCRGSNRTSFGAFAIFLERGEVLQPDVQFAIWNCSGLSQQFRFVDRRSDSHELAGARPCETARLETRAHRGKDLDRANDARVFFETARRSSKSLVSEVGEASEPEALPCFSLDEPSDDASADEAASRFHTGKRDELTVERRSGVRSEITRAGSKDVRRICRVAFRRTPLKRDLARLATTHRRRERSSSGSLTRTFRVAGCASQRNSSGSAAGFRGRFHRRKFNENEAI